MRDLLTVATFTMKDLLKRKSFIISNIVIWVIIIALFNVPNILKMINGDDDVSSTTKLLIVDNDNIFEGALEILKESQLGYDVQISNDELSFDNIKEKIDNGDINQAIIIKSGNGNINIEYIVQSLLYVSEVPKDIVSSLSTIYTNLQISKLNLTPQQLQNITPNFSFEMKQTETQEVQGNNIVMMLLSLVLFYAIYFCAYQVSTSITTEKTSKIIETLVTSTNPRTIVLGKTIGIGIVGLLQVFAMIIIALISNSLFLEEGILDKIISIENLTPFLLIMTLVYFLLGYFAYALMYALTGSTVSKPEDVQSANSPVAILAVIGFYLAYFTMMNPTSDLNVFASIFPLSSAFCMPFRIMMGIATTKDIILSILVLILTIIIIARISIKIYSNAILNYGSKINLKDIFKFYKQN
ncbi:MAG: ABC transporter permease [Clostridia bacterium]|nr:ABC transporter permease [Clostridia bacterium]